MHGSSAPKHKGSKTSENKATPKKSTVRFLHQFARTYNAPVKGHELPGIVLN